MKLLLNCSDALLATGWQDSNCSNAAITTSNAFGSLHTAVFTFHTINYHIWNMVWTACNTRAGTEYRFHLFCLQYSQALPNIKKYFAAVVGSFTVWENGEVQNLWLSKQCEVTHKGTHQFGHLYQRKWKQREYKIQLWDVWGWACGYKVGELDKAFLKKWI